jgi:hypothetical protein
MMNTKGRFAVQSLIATIIFNAILLGVIYTLVGDALQASNQTLMFFALGALLTLMLWFAVYSLGSRLIEQDVPERVLAGASAPSPAPARAAAPETPPVALRDRVKPQETAMSAEAGAVQMLAILQREGRFVDFLQEDLSLYDDAQIGAAVRQIHEGCKKALAEHARLEPIYREPEGSSVTVQSGFDMEAVRLTGNVTGEPPFSGALQHRGWRVAQINLPRQAPVRGRELIVAPAEVEVQA